MWETRKMVWIRDFTEYHTCNVWWRQCVKNKEGLQSLTSKMALIIIEQNKIATFNHIINIIKIGNSSRKKEKYMIIENIIESHRQNKHRDDEDNVQIIQKNWGNWGNWGKIISHHEWLVTIDWDYVPADPIQNWNSQHHIAAEVMCETPLHITSHFHVAT